MQLNLINADGKASDSAIELADHAFGREFNEDLVHQVVVAYMAAGRAGTKAQKSRSDVSGGGSKPFRQKGTGRARAGTIRSPLWRGGGKTFAAQPRDYSQKVNRKMYRAAMRAILSELVRQERLLVVDSFGVDAPKTRELVGKLQGMGLNHVMIVADSVDDNLFLSARNLHWADVREAKRIDPVSLIQYEKVLMTSAAVKQLEEALA